jgi:hypothetical protein
MIGGLGAYTQNGILTTEFCGEMDPIVRNRQLYIRWNPCIL